MYLQSVTGKELTNCRWSFLMFSVHIHCATTSQRWFSHELRVKSVASESFHHSGYASVEQLHNSQTQLLLPALQKNTVVVILYTGTPYTLGYQGFNHLLYLEAMVLLHFPTGSSKVSAMSAITLPSL